MMERPWNHDAGRHAGAARQAWRRQPATIPELVAEATDDPAFDIRLDRDEDYVGLDPIRRDGTNAWVSMSYVSLNVSLDDVPEAEAPPTPTAARRGRSLSASTREARFGTCHCGRIRNRLLATTRERLARRACGHQPIHPSRAASCQAAALKANAPNQPIRGARISMIFQEPMTSLNPVFTVGDQVMEPIMIHEGVSREEARERVMQLFREVDIPDPERRIDSYPHEMSGGMRQRAMIAMALSTEPELLIADEPTTALDVTIQAKILELMKDLREQNDMAIMLITHDLGVVAELCHRVAVMYAGQIVEQAPRDAFYRQPRHPYSRMLFSALPDSSKREARLAVIPGTVPALNQEFRGCRFAGRCDRGWSHCERAVPDWFETGSETGVRCHLADPQISAPGSRAEQAERATGQQVYGQDPAQRAELLQVDGLKVFFPIHKGFFKRVVGHVRAVDDVSIRIPRGQTLALVGESGCGKTTAGRTLLRLLEPTAGKVEFAGRDVTLLVSDYVEGEPLSAFLRRQPGRRLGFFQGLHLLHDLAAAGRLAANASSSASPAHKAPAGRTRDHTPLVALTGPRQGNLA